MQLNHLYSMKAEEILPLMSKGSIDMIYIDPPYNTASNQFEYHDNYPDWDNMMENVLFQSKDILSESACIFISIDDNKLIELRNIANKIFGKNNFLGLFITRQATRSNSKQINTIHEYIVVYAKNKSLCPSFETKRINIPEYQKVIQYLHKQVKNILKNQGFEQANKWLKQELKKYDNNPLFSWLRNYHSIDDNGNIYYEKDLSTPSSPKALNIDEIGLFLPALKTRGWVSKNRFIQLHKENRLVFKNNRPYEKHYLIDSTDNAMSILNFYSRQGKHDLNKLNMRNLFTTAKPVDLIKYLIKIATKEDAIILDFFAGSGTTAQAVIECNQEENSNRQFILAQPPEKIKNNIIAKQYLLQNGYTDTIDGIAQMRIDRVKKKFNLI